ncbi:ABC transporter permease subunit [Pseudarthrobacter sp. H2]|uniref:branched-chain amino acid ABC transporter ATP-binding protein/permease n=1 Tax=Pseudarthrobacter sp. H2 TaxID=3418415 RepID=UPI003CE97A3E
MTLWLRFRALPGWIIPLAIGVVIIILPLLGLSQPLARQIQLTLILTLVVSGLNLSLGFAGELALGQAAMYAAGAYTAGLLSKAGQTDLLVQLLLAALAALVVGLVTGVPGLRLGGWSLAMTSFFLVLLLPDIVSIFKGDTGGRNGLSGILSPTLFGITLKSDQLYMAIAVVAVLWLAFFRNLTVSRHGVAFRVLNQSPVLASSLGISVYRKKLLAYALGAVPAGLAGALFANLQHYISPESFSFTFATTVLAASILGGSASVYGALVGATILQFALNQSSQLQQYSLLFSGAFLVIGGVVLTGGLVGLVRVVVRRLDAKAAATLPPREIFPGKLEGLQGESLQVVGVSKSFGGNQALKAVSLTAQPGRVTALIGPNGSGKTTLLNMISGFYRTDSGLVKVGDHEVQGLSPDNVARAGVTRTFQTPNIPEGISVFDAVVAGRYARTPVGLVSSVLRLPKFRRVRRDDQRVAEQMLALVGLGQHRDSEATSLPLGHRRMLEVARCLVADPRVLLLDEVASGLDEDEVGRLEDVIRKVTAAGGTVVLVEHNFQLVLDLADDIVVLAHGEVMAQGSPAEIESNPRVLSEYLGVSADELAPGASMIGDLL